MFVRVKKTPLSPRKSVQICESVRVGEKVKQTIVRHVGIALDDEELKKLLQLAEVIRINLESERGKTLTLMPPEEIVNLNQEFIQKKPLLPVEEVRLGNLQEVERKIDGISDIFGTLFDELGFNSILNKKSSQVLKATVIARVAQPSSKHRTAELLAKDFGIDIPLDQIYRMMDALAQKQDVVQQIALEGTLKLIPEKLDLVFFDVTTLYFESFDADSLRDFGYSKDQKFHMTQVVLALATTSQGLPIGYKLFSGSTAEVTTLIACIDEWKKSIAIGHTIFVGDRAIFCEKNLKALESAGLKYIVAAPLRKLKREIQAQILEEKDYQISVFEDQLAWIKEMNLPESKRRLITSYNTKRAYKDQSDRDQLIEKIKKKLGKKPKQKKLISNKGYIKLTKTDDSTIASIDETKVELDAQWDGLHGVITNSEDQSREILGRYRQLWTVEESFRINKHDLKMKPIYHFKMERIQAHICICYIAYALARHAEYRISIQQKKMSFNAIRNELLKVQSSILEEKNTKDLYRLPSAISPTAKKIYHCFGITRSSKPTALNP